MGILTVLMPYKKYLVVVALAASFYGGYHYRDLSADKTEAEYKQETAEAIVAAQALALAYTQNMQTLANKLEEQSYENKIKRDKELQYYRNLVEQSGGLYDPYSQTGDSTTAGSSSSNQASTSGPRLSKELTQFLYDQANKADQVVDQFLQCRQYVLSITEQTISEVSK